MSMEEVCDTHTVREVWHIIINTLIVFSLPGDGLLKTVVENSLGQGHKSY